MGLPYFEMDLVLDFFCYLYLLFYYFLFCFASHIVISPPAIAIAKEKLISIASLLPLKARKSDSWKIERAIKKRYKELLAKMKQRRF